MLRLVFATSEQCDWANRLGRDLRYPYDLVEVRARGLLQEFSGLVVLVCSGAGDGVTLVRQLRASGYGALVYAITEDICPEAAAMLLAAGADSWLPAAMDRKLLLAFLHAAQRRASCESPVQPAVASPERLTLRVCGQAVRLRAAEFRIINYLMINQGRWVCEAELRQQVLGAGTHSSESLVRVHVSNIRKALGPSHSCIQSRRGLGYCYRATGDVH